MPHFATKILVVIAIVFQSFVAAADIPDVHMPSPDHLQVEHQHIEHSNAADNLFAEDEHENHDCHHCGHCHGSHSPWVSAEKSNFARHHTLKPFYGYPKPFAQRYIEVMLRPPIA